MSFYSKAAELSSRRESFAVATVVRVQGSSSAKLGSKALIDDRGKIVMGWVGGGDAKIVAAAALWFGFAHLMNYLLYASLFGGALTLLLVQFRQWPLPYALAGQPWLLRLHAKESGIPYGIALAIGALLIYPETEWVKAVNLAHFALR